MYKGVLQTPLKGKNTHNGDRLLNLRLELEAHNPTFYENLYNKRKPT